MKTLTTYATIAAVALVTAGAAASEPRGAAPELAFVRAGEIYAVRTDGTELRRITKGFTPAWSPDGEQIAFVREPGGNAEIYVSDADGANVRRITRMRGGDVNPTWSPDGTRIAFSSNRRGLYRIYTMRIDGTDVRLVVKRRVTGNSFNPDWSPDGKRIVFSSVAWTPENPEIYSVRPDGSDLRRLTRTRGSTEVLGDDGWPTWSPDGARIAFTSNRTGDGEIWIMRADGSAQHRIAGRRRRDDWVPSFSPDGTLIAFHSLGAVEPGTLYVVRPNGTGLRNLGIAGTDAAFRPAATSRR